jgi:hypothetical protein
MTDESSGEEDDADARIAARMHMMGRGDAMRVTGSGSPTRR